MQITSFNYEGNRNEISERDLYKIFDKEDLGREMLKQFDKIGMLGINFGDPQFEMVFIRQDERYYLNLAKYINFIRSQPKRTLSPETLEDLTSRKPWIHPAETPKFRK